MEKYLTDNPEEATFLFFAMNKISQVLFLLLLNFYIIHDKMEMQTEF